MAVVRYVSDQDELFVSEDNPSLHTLEQLGWEKDTEYVDPAVVPNEEVVPSQPDESDEDGDGGTDENEAIVPEDDDDDESADEEGEPEPAKPAPKRSRRR